MVSAYILVQTNVGKSHEVSQAICAIDGVKAADEVTGPYDIIVLAEADSMEDLGTLVIAKVQQVPSITRTVTCPVVRIG